MLCGSNNDPLTFLFGRVVSSIMFVVIQWSVVKQHKFSKEGVKNLISAIVPKQLYTNIHN